MEPPPQKVTTILTDIFTHKILFERFHSHPSRLWTHPKRQNVQHRQDENAQRRNVNHEQHMVDLRLCEGYLWETWSAQQPTDCSHYLGRHTRWQRQLATPGTCHGLGRHISTMAALRSMGRTIACLPATVVALLDARLCWSAGRFRAAAVARAGEGI